MKAKNIVCFTIYIFLFAYTASAKQIEPSIKQQLTAEILELSKDLNTAKEQLQKLTQTNAQVKSALNDMEAWAILQQEEKEKYYTQVVRTSSELSELQGLIDVQKVSQEKLQNKYSRIKSVMGCLAGSILAILCYRFLGTITSAAALAGAPQLKLIGYLAPVLGFGAGYFLIYIYF